MTQTDTKERILDAAETLFAVKGFNGTSLRAITTVAKVNLAAVSYHFGSKKGLADALFDRRLIPLNEIRLQQISAVVAAAQKKKQPPTVAEVICAFLVPALEFKRHTPGARHFTRLIWQAFLGGDMVLQQRFLQRVGPVMTALLDALVLALPSIPREILAWRLQLTLGATGQVMIYGPERPAVVPGGSLSEERMQKELLEFVIGGLEASHEG